MVAPDLEPDLSGIRRHRAHRVIANSCYIRHLCMDATGRNDISVLSPGVDHDRFVSAPMALCKRGGDPIVLFVGAMHPRKGADVFARAIALLDDIPASFVFAGPTGPLELTVKSIVWGYLRRNGSTFAGN